MDDIEEASGILAALHDFLGKTPWLDETAENICRYYNSFRAYIRDSSTNWSAQDRGECFAAHYVNLMSFHYQLYLNYYIDLNNVDINYNKFLFVMSKLHKPYYLQKLQSEATKIMCEVETIKTERENLPRTSGDEFQKYLIPLGIVNVETLSNCPDQALRQQVQNMLLLRIINSLEETMTKSITLDSYTDFRSTFILGNVYGMIGHYQVSVQHFEMANKILKNETNSQNGNEMQLSKDCLKRDIYLQLKNRGSSINEIKSYISERQQRKSGGIDNIFIEKKYVKYCVKLWMEESMIILINFISVGEFCFIQNLCTQIHIVDRLDKIPSPFNESKYYLLLKNIQALISKDREKYILNQWAQLVIESIINNSKSSAKGLTFLQVLVDLLSSERVACEIIRKFKLDDFCKNKISLKDVLEVIIAYDDSLGNNIAILQEAAQSVLLEEDLFFSSKLKEIIDSYLIPINIQECKHDGRTVLEVMGRNIAISHHLNSIEESLSYNLAIEEVRFVATDVLHIDLNFRKNIWHGKNIIVYTKLLKVHDKVEWDVSGNDNTYVDGQTAGTDVNNKGEDGKDGYSGESGGNILMIVGGIDGAHNFSIISNGGRGGNGQDGGSGVNGEDGKGITKEDLDKRFSAPLKLFDLLSNRIEKNRIIMKEIKNKNSFKKIPAKTLVTDDYFYYYIEGFSEEGNSITTCCHPEGDYLLCKGTEGKRGTKGGIRGLGGQGGFAGVIECITPDSGEKICVDTQAVRGPDGAAGRDGVDGICGKNGWDIGYVDYEFWQKTLNYGEDQHSKLKLQYYESDNSPSTRVWCHFKKKYVGIEVFRIEHRKELNLQRKKTIELSRNRKWHAQAVRKKATQHQQIKERYSYYMTFDNKQYLQDLRTQLDKTKKNAFQALATDKEQEKSSTMQLNIRRIINLQKPKITKKTNINIKCNIMDHSEEENTDRTINILERNPDIPNNWMKLSTVHLEFHKIKKIYDLFLSLKSTTTEEWHSVEQLLHKKYAFATLQEMSKQLSAKLLSCKQLHSLNSVPQDKASRYLYKKTQAEFDARNELNEIDSLKQYLFQDDTNKREIVLEHSLKHPENCKALTISLQTFIKESINKSNVQATSKIGSAYQKFVENLERIYFNAFKTELSKPRHESVFDLWTQSLIDESLVNQAVDCIAKDEFLHALYSQYNKQYNQGFNWDSYEIDKDVDLLDQYKQFVHDEGLKSECYRILLAYLYDVCLRFYTEDENNKFILRKVYNYDGDKFVHIGFKNDQFIELSIDGDFASLEQNRLQAAKRFSQILHQVLAFKRKDQIDEYIQNKLFDIECDSFEKINSSLDDGQAIEQIVSTFPENDDRVLIQNMLKKISCEYVEQNMILQVLQGVLSVEKRFVSRDELCFMINCILAAILEDRNEMDLYCWILASYPQSDWIDHFLLMEFENYYKKSFTETLEILSYMNRILNKKVLIWLHVKLHKFNNFSTSEMKNVLHLLSNIPTVTVDLNELELSEWSYALKENLWSFKVSQLKEFPEIISIELTDYVLSLENRYGYSMTESLLSTLAVKKGELEKNMVSDILSKFHAEKWTLSEKVVKALNQEKIKDWLKQMEEKFTIHKTERNIGCLVELIREQNCVSEEIIRNLDDIQSIIQKMESERSIMNLKNINNTFGKYIESWKNKDDSKITSKDWQAATAEEILKLIDNCIKLKRGFRLRDAQKLAILTLLKNKRSTLAQVSTGEGKSLIVVSVAIIKALKGEKVHIVTSSSVLAKRDADENHDIYSSFGVTVFHNCTENIDERQATYSSSSVVYGDLVNFQRDYLLDRFYQKNIYGDHNFKNVIVDEVDSMLLDKGNNVLYLSHDLPDFDKLEAVYLFIWLWLNKPVSNKEEVRDIFNVETIKTAVLDDIYGLIKMEDIKQISPNLTSSQLNKIQHMLTSLQYVDTSGKLLRTTVDKNELVESLGPELSSYGERLIFLINERIERNKRIPVPNYLKPFIERHLETWIHSAINAYFMAPDHDYVIDVDRSGTRSDLNPNIIIIDRSTGTDQANSQWEGALHQFLQLKHGCKISLQSLKAVFISNISYFKLYSNLYGLTGTLGSQIERDLLKAMYDVDFVIIPTAKLKLFNEEVPFLCSSMNDWIESIVQETMIKIEKKRSVLIICETVNDVDMIHRAFVDKKTSNVHTYVRDYEKLDVCENGTNLTNGQIIIATNLAGRGKDFKISKELKKAKGLHVLLTYLPDNIRIEQQAFGRAARCGDEGSGKLILLSATGGKYSYVKVLEMKRKRDQDEILRISNIRAHYESQIQTEEYCFKMFQKEYESVTKILLSEDVSNISLPLLKQIYKKTYIESSKLKVFKSNVTEILTISYLDKWAFWLDENTNHIANKKEEELDVLMEHFLSDLHKMDLDPVPLMKLGKLLIMNNLNHEAVELFNRLIGNEPEFCEAAHYYKAFALSKQIVSNQDTNGNLKGMICELHQAERLFDERYQFLITSAGFIANFKHENKDNVIRIDAYGQQQNSMVHCYSKLLESIDDILGHPVSPQSFVNHRIDETLAEFLYEDLLTRDILSKPKVANHIHQQQLELLSTRFGVSLASIKKFLSHYSENNIKEEDFIKEMKLEILFPSREQFWNLLQEKNVFQNEAKYVFVSEDKMIDLKNSLPNDLLRQKYNITNQIDDNRNIFLYNELLQQQANDHMFKKDEFIRAVGFETYNRWKKFGFLTFNKKAQFDMNEAKSAKFNCFNSVSITDFEMVGISLSDAKEILNEMKRKNYVIENDKKYYLDSSVEKVNDLQIDWCPLYEVPVKQLFSICFAYRESLRRIITQFEENINPVCIGLMPKPHQKFSQELMKQRIIEPVKVVIIDAENQLDEMYEFPKTKEGIRNMLARYKLISEEKLDELIDHLIKKKWITPLLINLPMAESNSVVPNKIIEIKDVLNVKAGIIGGTYTINNEESRQKYLDEKYMSIESKLKQILNNLLALSNKDIQKHISNTLNRSRYALKALSTIDSRLKPLFDYSVETNFSNVDEVFIFFLNGINELLLLEEKKWTAEMLFNTFSVGAIASAQIALGLLIQVYYVGAMTHVASWVISEGISDIFFAAGALRTGYFSWQDYRKHKFESICLTALTAGVGALFSRGVKSSRFAYEFLAPTLEISGTTASQLAGSMLARELTNKFGKNGYKMLFTAAVKRASLKIFENVVLAGSYAAIDQVVENYLSGISNEIGSKILFNIDNTIDKHSISSLLKQAYMERGEVKARKLINNITEETFSANTFESRFIDTATKIAGSIIKGCNEAAEKKGEKTIALQIGKLLYWTEKLYSLYEITSITNDILENLETKLRNSLDGSLKLSEVVSDVSETTYESFKNETINQWKNHLRQRAGKIIEQRIIIPILKDGVSRLVKSAGKAIQNAYNAYNQSANRERFVFLKQNNEHELKAAGSASEKKDEIIQIYQKKLLQLMIKTKSPKLFSDIIKECVPMDLTCVNACVHVLHKVLINMGENVSNLTIHVDTTDGIKQTFSSGIAGVRGETVGLILKSIHFQLVNSDESSNCPSPNSKNDCLFTALKQRFPVLSGMSSDYFRTLICNEIAQNPAIRNTIIMGWHRLPISIGVVGGATRRVTNIIDKNKRITSASDHLFRRMIECIRYAGSTQFVSEEKGIHRDNVITIGPSAFQDESSKQKGVHAAHLVRIKNINEKIGKHKTFLYGKPGEVDYCYCLLANYAGQTELVEMYVNISLGRIVDKFQGEAFPKLNAIDYSTGSFTTDDIETVEKFRKQYLSVIEIYYNRRYYMNEFKSIKEIVNSNSTTDDVEKKVQKQFFSAIEANYKKRNNMNKFKSIKETVNSRSTTNDIEKKVKKQFLSAIKSTYEETIYMNEFESIKKKVYGVSVIELLTIGHEAYKLNNSAEYCNSRKERAEVFPVKSKKKGIEITKQVLDTRFGNPEFSDPNVKHQKRQ